LIFAHWGWPEQLTSDNGSQYVSKEFAKSSHSNGIKHVRVALNSPSSNGATESFKQTFKRTVKTMAEEEETRSKDWLLLCWKTPQATTYGGSGSAVDETFSKKKPVRFDSTYSQNLGENMQMEKQAHDRCAKEHNFEPSPRVWVDITELQISSRRCDYTNWTGFL